LPKKVEGESIDLLSKEGDVLLNKIRGEGGREGGREGGKGKRVPKNCALIDHKGTHTNA